MFDNEALLKELLSTFALEAQEHVDDLSTLLLALERETGSAEQGALVESIFRRMHTLKGAAHAVNLTDVAHNCQQVEDLLADLKRGDLTFELPLFDRLHKEINTISQQVSKAVHRSTQEGDAPAIPALPPGLPVQGEPAWSRPPERIVRPRAQGEPPPQAPPQQHSAATTQAWPGAAVKREKRPQAAGRPQGDETIRVSARLLESLLLRSEELVSVKLAASGLLEELSARAAELTARTAERSRALDLARKTLKHFQADPQLAALAVAVEQSCQSERLAEGALRALAKSAEKHNRGLQGAVDPLLEDVKKLNLLPFSTLLEPFPKLVRDMARQLDKEAALYCHGAEIEIDRRILAELKEPLLHLVRNMVDHGLEQPAERGAVGKPEKGSLSIEVRLQDANRAELVISDDGCGIDLAQVKGAALRLELADAETLERMSDSDRLQLIFESGISTSRIISSISGRGVGLAIVRDALERLGGHVTVETEQGQGTSFRLCFPLSFARMRGVLLQTAGRDCVVPATSVELSTRVPVSEIRRVENRDTVVISGEVVALVSLAGLLELSPAAAPDDWQSLVLLKAGEKRIAFAVDQVTGVQEILVKPLGSQLSRVRNVAGATVLGSGRVVPVLNVADLFRSALSGPALAAVGAPSPAGAKRAPLSVLVAEDSITSRTLMKNILESCGYLVSTAVDGVDALTRLKSDSFDIVISDVEMPRMDGFQLTAAIRGDSRFASLPVILVTGLESRSDRERGIDVGASAYLVKSSFDQGNLLDIIQKLT